DTLTTTHHTTTHHTTATLHRHTDDTLTFHTNLNTIHPPPTDGVHEPEPHPVLPTTPWHHGHHWVNLGRRRAAGGSAPAPGTLLGEHITLATSPPAHLWQARLVPEAKPYPGEHRLRGVDVVPISVLLQTLSVAAAECGATALLDVEFEHPIVVDRSRSIQVVADDHSVTVASAAEQQTSGQRWVRHASARLGHRPEHDAPGPAAEADGRELIDYDVSSVDELQRSWGVEGRPFPWSVGPCRQTPSGLHAEVTTPQASTVALLDAAVHLARLADGSNPVLMVPAGVGRVHLAAGEVGACGSVEVYRRGGGGGELVVDVVVKGPDGRTSVDIRSLRFTTLESDPVPQNATDADPRTFVHAIEWRPWSGPSGPGHSDGPLATVAVIGRGLAAGRLREVLSDNGYRSAGAADARYVVYVAEPCSTEETDVGCAVRMSGDVSRLVRTLSRRDGHRPATLWIVTRGVRESGTDAAVRQSCLWGLAGVIGAEQPDLWGGLIDLPDDDNSGRYAAAVSRVLPVAAGTILVLRDGEFSAPALERVSGPAVREPLRCRPDSAYLVTGGLGALGLLTAAWLADRGARRLVLAGRTALPPRSAWDSHRDDPVLAHRISVIRNLEMRGVSVESVALDVGSREAVQALLDQRDHLGAPPIRGVIHGAGVAESRLLTDVSDESLRHVLWPKVAGAQALHDAFPVGSLDFFFLTASAGAVFGVPGQGAYAAANAHLDGLARARRRQGDHTMSLDWVAWRGLGFAAGADVVDEELHRVGSRPIQAEEAFAAWEYAQRYDVAQAVVAPLPGAREEVRPDVGRGRGAGREWTQMSADEMLDELATGLRAILADELQMPQTEIESDRPFAELGLNSVMAMSIRREAEELVGIELSATMLWNHPTIASLSEYIANRLRPGDDVAPESETASETSVLDALFADAETATAGSESGR
ncbi:type I polyketide synthase, partial [Mycolicibacterium litorale]|uniref:type I polyketide synthase n=1 Tax=Mycolicibacterium litorale TaxID=758802 RepID=UPI0023DFB8AB